MMGTWYIHSVWKGEASEVNEPEGRCHDTVLVQKEPLVIESTEHYVNRTNGQNTTVESELRIDTTLPLESTWGSFLNSELTRSHFVPSLLIVYGCGMITYYVTNY